MTKELRRERNNREGRNNICQEILQSLRHYIRQAGRQIWWRNIQPWKVALVASCFPRSDYWPRSPLSFPPPWLFKPATLYGEVFSVSLYVYKNPE